MKKKLKVNAVPLTFLILIIITFILFQPRMLSFLPQRREYDLRQFVKSSQENKQIDSSYYWKFREFYYPGSFTQDKDSIRENSLDKDIAEFLPSDHTNYVFLKYQSKYLKSIDVLTNAKDLTSLFKDKTSLENMNNLIFSHGKSTIIVLLRNNEEMQKVNGFLMYKDRDKDLIKGKRWLSITIVNP